MVSTWFQRKQEQSYLEQLEQIVVQRLRVADDNTRTVASRPAQIQARDSEFEPTPLSPLSREINEELDRLEQLVSQADR